MLVNRTALAGIYTSFQTLFNQVFTDTKTYWEKLATLVPSETSEEDYKWLGALPMLREWIGDRHVKALVADNYKIVNKHYESTVAVDRDDIEDDKIGVYRPSIMALGQNAAQHPDKLIFDLLMAGFTTTCYDGQYFFDGDHPVGEGTVSNDGGGGGNAWFLLDLSKPLLPLIFQQRTKPNLVSQEEEKDESVFMRREYRYGVDYRGNVGYALWQLAYGSKDTLNASNYSAAYEAMMAFKNDEGVPLGVVPTMLVVGPSNRTEGLDILKAERDAAGKTNVNKDSADLLVVPWLD